MNIIFYRYNSICEPAFISCFKRAGITVIEDTTEIENKNATGVDLVKRVSKLIEETKPVFIISINFFPALSAVCNVYKVPYVSIIVDCPVWELYSFEVKNPINHIFVFDKVQWKRISPQNPTGVVHMPLCADTETFANVIVNSNDSLKSKFTCDISFVGSLYSEKCAYNKATHFSDYTRGYIDGLVNAATGLFGINPIYDAISDKMVDKILSEENIYTFPENSVCDYRAVIADGIVGDKVSEAERIMILKAISEDFGYSIDLYTGSDTSMLPKVNNRGFAKSLTEMPLIFNQSKINLNITTKTIQSGISQRVFDVLACGGFLISNYQEELFEFFTPGKDLEIFTDLEDLHEKIDFYLSHEAARKEIALCGYDTVTKNHSVAARINQILAAL